MMRKEEQLSGYEKANLNPGRPSSSSWRLFFAFYVSNGVRVCEQLGT